MLFYAQRDKALRVSLLLGLLYSSPTGASQPEEAATGNANYGAWQFSKRVRAGRVYA